MIKQFFLFLFLLFTFSIVRGEEFEVEATAYSYTGSRTYTGVYPAPGIIAVDPDVIPLGSICFVENYGYCVAP